MRHAIAAVSAALVLGPVAAADSPEPVGLKGHKGPVVAAAWAADGKSLASAGDDRSIRLWDPGTGREAKSLADVARKGYGSPVVAYTADLKTVAVNYWGEITIRTAADGKELRKIDPILDRGQQSTFRPDVYAMAFSPDGKRLATAGADKVVRVWDAESGEEMMALPAGDRVEAVAFSPDGKSLAAGGRDGTIGVWAVPAK
jgi:WD40 repeat protein